LLRPVHITRFLSGFLLVVFAFSITPKRFLHDVFAKHIDNKPQKNNDAPWQLTNAGYNCDSDNLVAESNFVSDQQVFSVPLFLSFSSYILKDISFSSASGIYSSLRGPPVNI
jgi:hypothetical protein